MNHSEDDLQKDTKISDFAKILEPKEGEVAPVVVGGHAVNLWSEYYLSRNVIELSAHLPFTSKDLDIVGPLGLLDRLSDAHQGKLFCSEGRSPVLGRVDVERAEGGYLRVEVLHTVLGLSHKDLSRVIQLGAGEVVANVLLPHLVLKAKIENSESISQDGRNDVKHVRMMMLCVRAFIEEFADFVTEGKASERMLINFLQETLEIVTSSHAIKATELWGFHFEQIWPFETLKRIGGGKVARWLEHRFA